MLSFLCTNIKIVLPFLYNRVRDVVIRYRKVDALMVALGKRRIMNLYTLLEIFHLVRLCQHLDGKRKNSLLIIKKKIFIV